MKPLRRPPDWPERSPSPGRLPELQVHPQGRIGSQDVRLYVPRALIQDVAIYAAGDARRCRGGLLLGVHGSDRGERYVEVRVHLPAERGRRTEDTFTFTRETWKETLSQKDSLWPDLEIVGWYYSHLDSGIFMSSTDVALHRMFFTQPYQFALVLDPRHSSLGFFCWQGKDLAPTGFMVIEPA